MAGFAAYATGTIFHAVITNNSRDGRDTTLSSPKTSMLREITILEDRVEDLEQHLSDERSRSSEKQEALLREIADLRANLERSNTIIELYEEGRLKPKE